MRDVRTAKSVRYLDEEAIRPLLRLEDLIPAMERALADFSSGRVLQPVRSIVSIPQHSGFMGLMPAVYGDVMGAKLVNLYPDNISRGIPTHQAVIALFRAGTGEPLAMMDGRLITELRTAAVSAVATKLLSSPNASRLAILGGGVQARSHFRALSIVRKFDDVRVWSRSGRFGVGEAGAGGVGTTGLGNTLILPRESMPHSAGPCDRRGGRDSGKPIRFSGGIRG